MSKQIRIDREQARESGWTDEQIDAYEASVNGQGQQYDAMQSESKTMQKSNNPEEVWIDRKAETSAITDAALTNIGLDVGKALGVGVGGYGLYRAGKAMFGGGKPGTTPAMTPPTAPVAPPTAPTPRIEPGGQRLTDFVRQTGPYTAPPAAPAMAPPAAAPMAPPAAQPSMLNRMMSAAAPYARFAGGAGMALTPGTLNTGEQQQLAQMQSPQSVAETQRNRQAIAQAGRQPTSSADLDQMIRAAAAKRALMMGQQGQ